ncbi:DUF6478 family protein [Paracoccus xiamenensis]|uniref:DUF6478 family protein n=1 Tax=Paracoccus xiamenensis TaxID=2714901 RepID=UPI00140D4616|nr:DUF6478 family protein [Paracoccus xiamenensis]NHF74686.1 hypothetical protein [Paracoccus xiamenensis]
MAPRLRSWIDRLQRQRVQAQWARLSEGTAGLRTGRISYLRDEAAILRRTLDRFLRQSDQRLAVSRADLKDVVLPGGTDWRWRPEFLSVPARPSGVAAPENAARLGESVAIWHDCAHRALMLRQVPNARATDLAAFGLRVEVMGFSGSFLSLSIDLPPAALQGLTRDYIIRLETTTESESAQEIYFRLNIGNGPNTEELLRHLGGTQAGQVNQTVTEFDLASTQMNEKRLDKIWLDVIFEKPQMNSVTIREMILSRHLRAHV